MPKTTPSKSIYFLMEIMIVLIFFALSSAICMQMVMQSHTKSIHGEKIRFAMKEGSNVVERIQATHEIPSSYQVIENERTYDITIDQEVKDGILTGNVTILQANEELLQLPFAFGEDK